VTDRRAGGLAGAAGPGQPDELLAALADATRRQLLATLASGGPATASTLACGLPISRQAVAKHLAVLERAGLVTSAKNGRDVLFDVRTAPLAQTADWLTALAAQWDRRLTSIKQIAEEEERT
jgi:DNA-binding transcriptional ArsR family regulator